MVALSKAAERHAEMNEKVPSSIEKDSIHSGTNEKKANQAGGSVSKKSLQWWWLDNEIANRTIQTG